MEKKCSSGCGTRIATGRTISPLRGRRRADGRDIKDGMAAAAASQRARSLGQIRKLLYENGVVLGRSAPVTQYTLDERICSAGNGEREAQKKVGGDERGEQHNT